jgi:hypothetical protein
MQGILEIYEEQREEIYRLRESLRKIKSIEHRCKIRGVGYDDEVYQEAVRGLKRPD